LIISGLARVGRACWNRSWRAKAKGRRWWRRQQRIAKCGIYLKIKPSSLKLGLLYTQLIVNAIFYPP
jgi:hypothetical protein